MMSQDRSSIACFAKRLLHEESGQDLVESALLLGIISLAGVVVFTTLADLMEDAYNDWGAEAQDAWEPCPPQPAVCP